MISRLKPLALPLLIAGFFAAIYIVRVHREMVDFEVYQVAATRIVDGEPLYRAEDGHYQYKYLPLFAFAVVPLTWVPDEVARAVWFAISAVLLVVLIRRSVTMVPEPTVTRRVLFWCAVLLLGKFYGRELNLGQTNILLAVVLLGALNAVRQRQPVLAGAFVALGIFVKPYTLILLPWIAWTAGPTSLAAALGFTAAGLLLPALVYGWTANLDQIVGWYRTVTTTTTPNLLNPENVSFNATWAKWIGVGTAAKQFSYVTTGFALAIASLVVALRRPVREPAYLEFGLLMLLVPLISPQGWDYVLLLGTPAVLCAVDRWRATPIAWRALTALSIAFMSFTIFDLIGRTLYTTFMAVNIVSVAALTLVVCLANLRFRRLA